MFLITGTYEILCAYLTTPVMNIQLHSQVTALYGQGGSHMQRGAESTILMSSMTLSCALFKYGLQFGTCNVLVLEWLRNCM